MCWGGRMPQLLKCYSYKHVDVSSIPRTHIKNVKHGTYSCNTNTGEAERDGSLGQSTLISELSANERQPQQCIVFLRVTPRLSSGIHTQVYKCMHICMYMCIRIHVHWHTNEQEYICTHIKEDKGVSLKDGSLFPEALASIMLLLLSCFSVIQLMMLTSRTWLG